MTPKNNTNFKKTNDSVAAELLFTALKILGHLQRVVTVRFRFGAPSLEKSISYLDFRFTRQKSKQSQKERKKRVGDDTVTPLKRPRPFHGPIQIIAQNLSNSNQHLECFGGSQWK